MENIFNLRRRILWCGIAVLSLLGTASFAVAANCAGTPAAAARSAGAGSSLSPLPEGKGYRVASVRWDPVMRQSWATIVSCAHPERPGILLRTGDANHAEHRLSVQVREDHTPVVRAGDMVQLWRQEDLLRIEVAGVAEQSGSVGETIRVRLLRRPGSNQSIEEQLSGVVRGRADVEMQP
ncbi:flagella basal body P-ring formation protein FlgA [Edaphobacter sp. DSM 109919]|uniref:Flagella basal body P-ring formation protein FlgA n=1 Tax=Edaphobacter paludis TaxID=3035702 RepID=A0AAU7CTT7_9BACT